MEFEAPWAPTSTAQREAAVQAYLEGEALCDAGDHAAGIRRLRQATRKAWELEQEEWPGWAIALRDNLIGGAAVPEPTLIGRVTDAWQPELADLDVHLTEKKSDVGGGGGGASGTWWRGNEAARRIATVLNARGVVLVDEFAGGDLLSRVRAECEHASEDGTLRPARLRTADDGLVSGEATQRGDRITWAGDDDERWAAVRALAATIDELVCALRESCGGRVATIGSRMRPMVARYGVGAGFARHADNHCLGGRGAHCDGRVLTAVYYMSSDDWDGAADGGCLRVYRPAAGSVEGGGGGGGAKLQQHEREIVTAVHAAAGEGDALMDVAPLSDRLVLFFSDLRCPHEVLPVTREGGTRAACTVWYVSL
eukprot:476173-Prymnesium_polylepis.3